ncbi:hypothetical protein D9611_006223 [Ephemerocybe angulata]|uniref:Uncharacterized protein n=1 Tax=Ephemerocybe angulata TaxID=980116 RepID=A0A8H5C657_9AGAR|nr:hypothetical protein D9611_006223 [Tulosesus angulatus]
MHCLLQASPLHAPGVPPKMFKAHHAAIAPEAQLEYTLPPAIQSIRDGWQLTFQSAAVVSGLLAGVAAQLFSYFKTNDAYPHGPSGTRLAVVTFCYLAMFFNIGATISGFILIDGLGEIQFHASTAVRKGEASSILPSAGPLEGSPLELLRRFDGGSYWTRLVYHWIISFCLGVLSLLLLLLIYIFSQEHKAMQYLSAILAIYLLLPVLFLLSNDRPENRYRQVPTMYGGSKKKGALDQTPVEVKIPEPSPDSGFGDGAILWPMGQPQEGEGVPATQSPYMLVPPQHSTNFPQPSSHPQELRLNTSMVQSGPL